MSLLAPSAADFPILPHTGVAYLDSGRDVADPDPGDRGDGRVLPGVPGQRPPRGLPDRGAGDGGLRGRARQGRGVRGLDARRRPSSPATRPRRSTSSRTRGGTRTSRAGDLIVITEMEHHSNLVPWQLLARAHGRGAGLRADRRRGPADRGGARRAARPRAEARRARARLQRARHDQPRRRHHRPRARRRRGRAGRRRAGRAAPAARRRTRSAPTSTPGPRTRPTGRPASACCTAGASCSRRCRRSSAAGT